MNVGDRTASNNNYKDLTSEKRKIFKENVNLDQILSNQSEEMSQSGRWVIHCITTNILTAIQLVSNDDKEGNTSAKGVDSDGYFTYDSCDFSTRGSNNLLIRAFVTDLKKPHR